jgi:replicative DNA helicase
MDYIKDFIDNVNNGKKGKNVGISTGLNKLDNLIYGIQKKYLYLIGSDSGAGKSSFVIDIFLYNLFKNNKNNKIEILLYSFEMDVNVIFAKLSSLYIYDTYHVVINYGDILSLSSPINDLYYSYVLSSVEWIKTIVNHITIYDKPLSPTAIYGTCKEWLSKFGEFIRLGEHKEDYIEKDSDIYKIVIIDHLGLISGPESKKQKMDTVSDYFIYFRNKCKITGVFIQQLNRNSKSVERKTNGYELLDNADLSDSSVPAQASETILLLYYPYREKIPRVEGYPIQNVLKHKFRLLQCTKNRFGQADKNIGLVFHGEIGLFKELPKPEDISDYSKYIML